MSNQRTYFIGAPVGGKLVSVGFDCVPSESVYAPATLTQYPVEAGAAITDHFYVNPVELNIQVIVSNTPLFAAKDDIVSVAGLGDTGAGTRASAAWTLLKKMQAAAVPFSVQTGFDRFSNMMISSLGAQRTAESAGALICDVTLTQVILTKVQTEALHKEKIAEEVETKATPVNEGKAVADAAKTRENEQAILREIEAFDRGVT